MNRHTWRVTTGFLLKALGLTVCALGCSEINTPSGPSPQAEAVATMSALAPVESVSEGTFPVGPELAAVRRATARFHEVSAAYAAGYTTENEPCVSSPAGAMGVHAPNPALIRDQAIDRLRPELLLYLPGPNGRYRLIGVEYIQAVLLRDRQTGDVAPRFDTSPWDPARYDVVNPNPKLFGHAFHLTPPPVPHVPWHWALHVWIWAHNPSGIFDEWNPSLRCD